MRKKVIYRITLFLLFLTATVSIALTACNGKLPWLTNSMAVRNPPLSLAQKPVATKIVNHAFGQVEIPLHPQRIVVLDGDNVFLLDALSALGIKPVGLTRCSNCIHSDAFSEFLGDVPIVGNNEQPSLEKILSLKPDLILGYKWQKSFYPLLSAIAPTVMIDIYSGGNDFQRNFKYLAEILNKSDRVEGILAQYNERIQKFRQQFGEKLKTKTVSLLAFWGSTVHVYKPELLFYAKVMSDAGLQFIPAYKTLKNDYLRLNLETVSDWDADFLFIEFYYQEEFEDLKSLLFFKEPIWSTLKAVRNKQVYIMTESGGGPITANQLIDELYGYFSSKL
ncbi:iron-siderophore ABC transporter substrate-binding protein [Candidatus Gracilibacteria bacterium]|nr:iron-siderophore ABC transporter substrate-binding protein [Candidatus Gracilibacteria bacterium]NJP21718.1 iron-siderophore ABC transporter substrate-binding protein [Hydrococcus sp. CRU_1_1]